MRRGGGRGQLHDTRTRAGEGRSAREEAGSHGDRDAGAEARAVLPSAGSDAVRDRGAGRTRTGVRGGVCRSLRLGSRGEDVTALQRALNTVMGFGLVVDGYFGPQTEAAVRAFQVRYGQVVDGVYGPQSAAAMSAIFAGQLLPVD